jgi:hypothetical protein
MSKRALERVTCTLPRDLVKAADALAAREGRSRSWVVAEALRRYLGPARPTEAPAGAVREGAVHPYADQFEDARRQRRDADLALTPEQRILAAEELARVAAEANPRPRFHGVLAFDSWEDFQAWKRQEARA